MRSLARGDDRRGATIPGWRAGRRRRLARRAAITVLLPGEVLGPGTKRLCQVIAHRLAMDAEQDAGVAWRSRPRLIHSHAINLRRTVNGDACGKQPDAGREPSES